MEELFFTVINAVDKSRWQGSLTIKQISIKMTSFDALAYTFTSYNTVDIKSFDLSIVAN